MGKSRRFHCKFFNVSHVAELYVLYAKRSLFGSMMKETLSSETENFLGVSMRLP